MHIQRISYAFLVASAGVGLFGVSGCSEEVGGAEPGAEAVGTGQLHLPLIAPSGGNFRLTNAVFDITGPGGTTLTLAAGASEIELVAELDPGAYRIALRGGWALEELSTGGAASVTHATLLSENPMSFVVRHDRVTQLVYEFATAGGVVTLGSGEATVSIDVSRVVPESVCDLRANSGCATGQSCLLLDDTGQTFCAASGSLPVGSPCTSEQCVRGAQCLKLDEEPSAAGVCTPFCDPTFAPFGCDCHSLSFSSEIGVCEAPALGSCDPVAQTGCATGEACQYDGGDSAACGPPGSASAGSSCLGNSCAAGLDCFEDDPDSELAGTCWQLCDTRTPNCAYVGWPYYFNPSCAPTGSGFLGVCAF